MNAAYQLIKRILPEHWNQFELEFIQPENELDVFEIENYGQLIKISGSSGVAIASGLHWYLREYCNAHFSWTGDQLKLPEKLPMVNEKVRVVSPFKYRYYLNYCTFSYSMPWWTWERWEREIDLMALHGINFPLSIVGNELVWENVFRAFGLKDEDILGSFAGPAFRAWGWMGNIEGWGGPLPKSWIENQRALQCKILKRQRELGMKPVMQGYAGFVPEKFKTLFPDAKINQLPGWYGFKGVFQVDPSDPLFKKIGARFMEEQFKLYGTDHFYSADIFHEIDVTSTDMDYLVRLSGEVFSNMKENDPDAIWVMQSWSLKEAILNVLPDEDVMILDLFCDSEPKWEKSDAFHGKHWIWCALQNFGGRTGMSGKLKLISEEIPKVLKNEKKGGLCGIGFAPEGIEHNPVFFSLLTEMAWREKSPDLIQWINSYIMRRYGKSMPEAEAAWKLLTETVYTGPESYGPAESEICALPSLDIKKVSSNGMCAVYYKPEKLAKAWQLLLLCNDSLGEAINYRYDLTDISRQVLANLAGPFYNMIQSAYHEKNVMKLKDAGQLFLELIRDMDRLLSTCEPFMLGKWIESSKILGETTEEKYILEWNARRQVTLWSSPEVNEFHDYANKQWAGLLNDYYLIRWEKFLCELERSLTECTEFDEKKFCHEMSMWSVKWSHQKNEFPATAQGSSFNVSLELFTKYKKHLALDSK